MIKKTVEVNLYDQFILYTGDPREFSCGFRHQTADIIFIIAPEFVKHELYALGSRDVGFPNEYHCSNPNCIGSGYVTQEKNAKLCDKHTQFIRDNLTGKFEYTLDSAIFSDENRYEKLLELLNQHSELFSQQTGISVRMGKVTRKDRKEVDGCWLISLREDGYKYHKHGFDWEEFYKEELRANTQSEPGNLAVHINLLESIAKHGDLDGYRKRKIEDR
jgi:hypothetical protein